MRCLLAKAVPARKMHVQPVDSGPYRSKQAIWLCGSVRVGTLSCAAENQIVDPGPSLHTFSETLAFRADSRIEVSIGVAPSCRGKEGCHLAA